jgi:hypothetical protein
MAKGKEEPDVVRYISHNDLNIVKERIPKEFHTRLRDTFIWGESYGVRTLGYVTKNGRRDVNLSAFLPYRVSLGRFLVKGQSALEFGTSPRGQWTPWAVRRFLLYDVFLHEIGHLQVVEKTNSNINRKFASETLAQKFADDLRRKLWSSHFDHPDPVHNSPQPDELSIIPFWQGLDKKQRFNLVEKVVQAPHEQLPDLNEFGKPDENQEKFLTRALCFGLN